MKIAPLRVGLPEHPVGMHPLAASDAKARLLIDLMWRPLVGSGRPALAQEVRSAGACVQVTLSPAARWQDGSPVCTDDAAHTLSLLGRRPGWRDVTLTPLSPATFELRLPFAAFAHQVRGLRLIRSGERQTMEVGNGPYRLDRCDRGWTATCCGEAAPGSPREIQFVVVPDALETLDAIERGDIHVAEIDEISLAQALARGWSHAPSARRPSAVVVDSKDPPAVEVLGFNVTCPALASRLVRQRLSAALDRRSLMPSPPTLATPCDSIFGSFGDELSTVASQEAQLDDCDFDICVAAGSASRGRLASLVAAQLARSGATVGLRPLPWSELVAVLMAGRFAAFLIALGSAPEDPAVGHRGLVEERGVCFSRTSSSIVDAAIDEASTALDATSRWRAAARVDAWIREMRPCVPLLRRHGRIYAFAAGIRPLFDAAGVWLERCQVGGPR